VIIDQVHRDEDGVVIEARAAASEASCPGCGARSARGTCRYWRRLADTPLAGLAVVVRLRVRRFNCCQPGCGRSTFVEQIPDLTRPHSRYSPPLKAALTSIAVALGGRPGSRLACALGMPVGRDSLLNLLRAQPDPQVAGHGDRG
jgi:hypothetical protein